MPSNTTPETAIVIPASSPTTAFANEQDVNEAGTTWTVWYKFTPAISGMYAVAAYGGFFGNLDYVPLMRIFSPDSSTRYPNDDTPIPDGRNVPMQFWGEEGVDYYFRISSLNGNLSGIAYLEFLLATQEVVIQTIPAGSIFINDDYPGLPLSVLSVDSGEVMAFIPDFISGEGGDRLADGHVLLENGTEDGDPTSPIRLTMVDENNFLHPLYQFEFAMPESGWQRTYLVGNKVDTFYVGWQYDYDNNDGGPSFRTISTNGVVGPLISLPHVGAGGLQGFAPSNDGTVLYYSGKDGALDWKIKRWDLVNNVPLSNFVESIGPGLPDLPFKPEDLLVMSDGAVVAQYMQVVPGSQNYKVIIYNPNGTVRATVAEYSQHVDMRLNYDVNPSLEAPEYFWVWTKAGQSLGTGVSTFLKYDLNGNLIDTITQSYTEMGISQDTSWTPDDSLAAAFGPSQSCPFWLSGAEIPYPPPTPPITPPNRLVDGWPCECCCPEAGAPGPNVGQLEPLEFHEWFKDCVGGGTVPEAPDLVDGESWIS